MAARGGRVVCPRCGANNFDTVTACWKCGTALSSGVGKVSPPPAYAAPPASAPYGDSAPRAAAPMPYAPALASADGDPAVARRAALALALMFPWIGLPVGWVFMMLEDHRKQAVGRFCATWSLIALVFHLLLMFALTQSTLVLLRNVVLPALGNFSRGQGGGSDGGEAGSSVSPYRYGQ